MPSDQKPYKVGYGQPPLHTRFKSGQSGNPTGGRKRPATVVEDLTAELQLPVQIETVDGTETLTTQRSIIKAFVTSARSGDARIVATLLALLAKHAPSAPFEQDDAREDPVLDEILEQDAASTQHIEESLPPPTAEPALPPTEEPPSPPKPEAASSPPEESLFSSIEDHQGHTANNTEGDANG